MTTENVKSILAEATSTGILYLNSRLSENEIREILNQFSSTDLSKISSIVFRRDTVLKNIDLVNLPNIVVKKSLEISKCSRIHCKSITVTNSLTFSDCDDLHISCDEINSTPCVMFYNIRSLRFDDNPLTRIVSKSLEFIKVTSFCGDYELTSKNI